MKKKITILLNSRLIYQSMSNGGSDARSRTYWRQIRYEKQVSYGEIVMSRTELTENELIEERIDLSRATCPNREQRANGINVWYGKASDLAKEARSGCLRQRERNFQQSSGCVLNFYLSVRIGTIRDAVAIYHAPVGCSSSALGYRELYRHVPVELGRPANYDLHWMTTNLGEKDVVYGAGDKLGAAIIEAEKRYSPKAIFILIGLTHLKRT